MRWVTLYIAVVIAAATAAGSGPPKPKIVCKTPDIANSCYWTHGRLSVYNGTPAFRLWKVGTHRVLGISSGPGAENIDEGDNEHPALPKAVTSKFKPMQNRVFGDFEVCPLEPERKGAMQGACIANAKNIVVEPSER